ncbi:MAG TPA: DUF542 domain-containing protein [bacterium]|nr:DUF542 domain-containing protein [bacterium]
MTPVPDKTIGQLAVECPHYIPVFEAHQLDYYQRGHRSLAQACQEAGLETAQVLRELEAQKPQPFLTDVDENSSLFDIVHFIVGRHHSYVRGQLERMEDLIQGVGGDGQAETQVSVLKRHFLGLDESLRRHLLEEEIEVFPRLVWIERNRLGKGMEDHGRDFREAIHHVLMDHHFMDRDFLELKKLVFHFRVLDPGSEFLEGFSKALDGLDQDNHRHIHLENNILLRKAVALGILKGPAAG